MTDPIPVPTPYGTLYVDPEELVIGRLLQEDGELPDISKELAFFRKYLNPGDTAIDVGANYGLFTLALAQVVGETGYVVAYEPNVDIIPHLKKTMEPLNGEVFRCAAGRAQADGGYRLDPRGSGGTQVRPEGVFGKDRRVKIWPLDESTRNHTRPVKAIKIDAEGMDVDVLLGAEKILKEDRPVVIFEWNPEAMWSLGKHGLHEFVELINLGIRVGYTFTDLNGKELPNTMTGNLGYLPDELLDS